MIHAMGRLRAALIHLVLVGIFGVWLPLEKGVEFLDAVILGAYACLGVVFPTSSATRPLENTSPLRRVMLSVVYGTSMSLVLLAAGLATVYATRTVFVGPDLLSLFESLLFGIALSLALASAAVWIGIRFSPVAARMAMRVVFIGLLAAFFWRSRWLPDVALWGAAISGVAGAGFVLMLRRKG
jgi:ABC-type enterochelin transport system permease subunit